MSIITPDMQDIVGRMGLHSSKVMVTAVIKLKGKIVGYTVRNLSNIPLPYEHILSYNADSRIGNVDKSTCILPGTEVMMRLDDFVAFACEPEIGFTFVNGQVRPKNTSNLNTNFKDRLNSYHFVPKDKCIGQYKVIDISKNSQYLPLFTY